MLSSHGIMLPRKEIYSKRQICLLLLYCYKALEDILRILRSNHYNKRFLLISKEKNLNLIAFRRKLSGTNFEYLGTYLGSKKPLFQ